MNKYNIKSEKLNVCAKKRKTQDRKFYTSTYCDLWLKENEFADFINPGIRKIYINKIQ